jgi:hypothetical protein
MNSVLHPGLATHFTLTSWDPSQAEAALLLAVDFGDVQTTEFVDGSGDAAENTTSAPNLPTVSVTVSVKRIALAPAGTCGEQLIVRAGSPNANGPCGEPDGFGCPTRES